MNDPVENSGDYSRTEPVRLTVPDTSYGRRLDQVLAELLPQHSRNRLQEIVMEQMKAYCQPDLVADVTQLQQQIEEQAMAWLQGKA